MRSFDLSAPAFPGARVTNAMHRPTRRRAVRLARPRPLRRPPASQRRRRCDLARDRRTGVPAQAGGPDRGQPDVAAGDRSGRPSSAWIIEPGHADEPGVLWCGTIPGGLFRSDDRGDSWQLVESLWNLPSRLKWFGGGYDDAGIHSVSVDPRGPGRLVVGVSCGGAWRTDDGGRPGRSRRTACGPTSSRPSRPATPTRRIPTASSAARPRPTCCGPSTTAASSDRPTTATSGPRSTEAGPSTFGFAVAVHPDDPDTAWFVPAVSDEVRIPVDGKFVVTRTRDGGESFDVLSDGPPAGARLRPDLPPRLRHRRQRRTAPDGLHHRFAVVDGQRWRRVARGQRQPAADRVGPLPLIRRLLRPRSPGAGRAARPCAPDRGRATRLAPTASR